MFALPPAAALVRAALVRAALVLGLASLGACAHSERGDAERYRQVLAADPLLTAAGVAQCGDIADIDLRGDCVVYVAGQRAADDDLSAEDVCQAAPEGLWRDECWFVSAEVMRRSRRRTEAAAHCLRSGRFKDDCGQHLWQSEVRAIAAPTRGDALPPTFEEALPRALSVYSRWAPLLEDDTDMAVRFWRRFYQNGFERRGWIDLGHCQGLDDDHRERCEDAGAKLMCTRVDQDLRHTGIDPCTLAQGVAPVAAPLRVVPHPALDSALWAWQQERCR